MTYNTFWRCRWRLCFEARTAKRRAIATLVTRPLLRVAPGIGCCPHVRVSTDPLILLYLLFSFTDWLGGAAAGHHKISVPNNLVSRQNQSFIPDQWSCCLSGPLPSSLSLIATSEPYRVRRHKLAAFAHPAVTFGFPDYTHPRSA